MQTRQFGSSKTKVAIVGQGTWRLDEGDRTRAVAALRRGLDAGMSHIDTAEMYGEGRVEELVAEAIADRRGEVFLVSKVYPHNASRRGTVAACERSLRRLRTDRIDLYLLHWRGNTPLAETMEAFMVLQQNGQIRHYGVSNLSLRDMQELSPLAGGQAVA